MARRWFYSFLIVSALVGCYEMPVDGRQSSAPRGVTGTYAKQPASLHAVSNLANDGTIPITIDLTDVKLQDGSRLNGRTLIFLYNIPAPEHEVARCIVVNNACSVVAIVPETTYGSYGFSILPEGNARSTALALLIQRVKVQ